MSKNLHLLIVDPQNDFCDLPESYCPVDPLDPEGGRIRPQLAVPGAHEDMKRLAEFIRQHTDKLSGMTITLDTHHYVGIERPAFWRHKDGSDPEPFTQISAAQLRDGTYTPRDVSLRERVQAYLDELEAAGRYTHMVWPRHCELGTWGHNVHDDVRAAYNAWEATGRGPANKILKGLNPYTEHYSAVKAEVPDPDDDSTGVNTNLLRALNDADVLLLAGEAGSHCVRATTEHLLEHLRPESPPEFVLLTDCMSPVAGFEVLYRDFLEDMRGCGVHTLTTREAASML